MSLLRKTVFGRAKLRQNTFIGGVAGTLSTPALLAVNLVINEQRIRLFEIRGNDIRCCIVGQYILPDIGFGDNASITYIIDYFNIENNGSTGNSFRNDWDIKYIELKKLKDIRGQMFLNCYSLRQLRLDSLTDLIPGGAFSRLFNGVNNCKIFMPSLQIIGSPSVNETLFGGVSNSTIYVNPFLETCNEGQPDADLIAAIAAGNTVVYVQNQSKPGKITDLSIGLKTPTTAQILFTNPESTNSLQEFEVSIDAIPYQTITASGQYITGLTSGVEYKNITVKAIDIYYNRAEESNQITFTTL